MTFYDIPLLIGISKDPAPPKISHYIFIITPASVDISGDFQDIFGGAGSFEMPINNGMS